MIVIIGLYVIFWVEKSCSVALRGHFPSRGMHRRFGSKLSEAEGIEPALSRVVEQSQPVTVSGASNPSSGVKLSGEVAWGDGTAAGMYVNYLGCGAVLYVMPTGAISMDSKQQQLLPKVLPASTITETK